MPDYISPSNVSIVTKDGECTLHITLDININLNQTGGLEVGPRRESPKTIEENEEEKTVWAIPEFKSGEKVKFGKKA